MRMSGGAKMVAVTARAEGGIDEGVEASVGVSVCTVSSTTRALGHWTRSVTAIATHANAT